MTSVNTTDDLLRIVRENEEFRAALRRELLTDDLLELPAQVAVMLETQNRILKDIADSRQTQSALLETQNRILADQDDMRQTQNRILEDIADSRQTQNSLLETQNKMSGDLEAQHDILRRQQRDFGRFRGNYAIFAARRKTWDIAMLFARLRGARRIRERVLTSNELSDMLGENYEAVDALNIRERAWGTFSHGDIIAEFTEWNGSGPGFYIAVEASYTGDREDARRAADHAKILRRATGLDTYAVVAAVRIAPDMDSAVFDDAARFVAANDENSAFWYKLGLDELEPDDPF